MFTDVIDVDNGDDNGGDDDVASNDDVDNDVDGKCNDVENAAVDV